MSPTGGSDTSVNVFAFYENRDNISVTVSGEDHPYNTIIAEMLILLQHITESEPQRKWHIQVAEDVHLILTMTVTWLDMGEGERPYARAGFTLLNPFDALATPVDPAAAIEGAPVTDAQRFSAYLDEE